MPPITRRFKLLYSTGDLSIAMPLSIIAFYHLFFMVNVAGLNAALAGTAVLIGGIWDAVNDPIMGIISDRIRSPRGRRRVVLLYGAIPVGLAFLLIFWVPPLGAVGKAIYYTLAIIIFDTVFTAVHVSFNALTPACTKDYDEQSSLNGYRMGYSIFGSLFAVILAVLLAPAFDNQRTFYFMLSLIIGLLSIIPVFIAYWVTEPYDNNEPSEEEMSPFEAMKATISNRPFLYLMGLYLFSWTAASLIATVLKFYADFYLGVPEQSDYFIVASQSSAIVFMPLVIWAAQRYDKRNTFIVCCIWWILIGLGLALVQPTQITLVYVLAILGGVGVANAYMLPWAMIPDVIDVDELNTGQRREGAFYAFAAFFQKLGTKLVIWLFGLALSATGFISSAGDGLPTQPASAVQAIRWSIGLAPALLLLLAIGCAYYYPLSRQSQAAVHNELASRRSLEATG